MPDDLNNQAAGEGADKGTGAGEGQQEGADQNKEANDKTTETGKEEAGDGGEGGEGGQKDTSKGQENAKAPTEGKETQQDDDIDDGAEPPVKPRLSKQDFIIGRQKAKLAKTAKADDNKGGDNDKGDDHAGEDEEVAPEDEALITKVVSPMLAPILEKSMKAEDEQEIAEFLKENPDFKPFEAKARRFMQHPSRRQLPIKSIFYEVAGDKLIRIGADRERAANTKAKETQTGGGSNRAAEGAKDDWKLSPEEFAEKQERIRRGQ
jgi:hypothetical protein